MYSRPSRSFRVGLDFLESFSQVIGLADTDLSFQLSTIFLFYLNLDVKKQFS